MTHANTLGIEFHTKDHFGFMLVLNKLHSRGLENLVCWFDKPGGAYLVSFKFPEKRRARFLKRHLGFLESLKAEVEG